MANILIKCHSLEGRLNIKWGRKNNYFDLFQMVPADDRPTAAAGPRPAGQRPAGQRPAGQWPAGQYVVRRPLIVPGLQVMWSPSHAVQVTRSPSHACHLGFANRQRPSSPPLGSAVVQRWASVLQFNGFRCFLFAVVVVVFPFSEIFQLFFRAERTSDSDSAH